MSIRIIHGRFYVGIYLARIKCYVKIGASTEFIFRDSVRDLVLERQTDLTDVFFVNRTTIPWPPEPLRGLTIKTILGYIHIEDRLYDAKKKIVA
jgi:hypothetical protein